MSKTIGNYSRAKLNGIISQNAGGITIEELDGAPSVADVSTIKVSNGSLTDDGAGIVTLNTAAPGATACTDEDSTQDIAIYTKTANEGISNVRVRWGSTKWNYDTSIFFSVGFHPTGGSLDNDSMVAGRSIGGIAAGVFIIGPYFTHGGAEWVATDQGSFYSGYWNYFMHSTLAHYQEAGNVYVGITVGRRGC